MYKLRLTLLALMLSCGRPGNEHTDNRTVSTESIEKIEHTIAVSQDEWGFVETTHCDSTFLSGLISLLREVDMRAAEVNPGQWYRRPVDYPECWAAGESRSTISRDPLLMVMVWSWYQKDWRTLEDMHQFAEDHFLKMGDGRNGGADTIMNSNLMSLLAEMIFQLGGPNHIISRQLGASFGVTDDPGEFYINRLTAIQIIMRKNLYGVVSGQTEAVASALHNKWSDNPMFALAAGKPQLAVHLLESGDVPGGIHNVSEYKYEWLFTAGVLIKEYGGDQ